MRPLIIGSGLAGLTVALTLAEAGVPSTVVARRAIAAATSSGWAQGGIAAAVGPDDHPDLHAADTIAAGAGLCDPDTVRLVTGQAPQAIDWLVKQGVPFDRDAKGDLALGLEGAHSKQRIVHVKGDSTGAAIMQALAERVAATPQINVLDQASVMSLHRDDAGICGATIARHGEERFFAARQIIIATGGAGALWEHTTNPADSWGQGLALAARVGARLRDLEFMQFHPTAIAVPNADAWSPLPLASEALRGEGARLVNEDGDTILDSDLVARDIVTRAIWKEFQAGHKVFLDMRMIAHFAEHFPAIDGFCQHAGIDPQHQPIPIRPAAHYHMGGVEVDASGQSSVTGLYACGEAASTGLHGANRLASNSLLEAVVMGRRLAAALQNGQPAPAAVRVPAMRTRSVATDAQNIRAIMTAHVGVLRDGTGLRQAIAQLEALAQQNDRALVALMIATAALRRQESRGGHARTDYPQTKAELARSTSLTIDDVILSKTSPRPSPKGGGRQPHGQHIICRMSTGFTVSAPSPLGEDRGKVLFNTTGTTHAIPPRSPSPPDCASRVGRGFRSRRRYHH